MFAEAEAAYKLAAALSNYDKDDVRNLRLLDIKTRKFDERLHHKNFLDINRNVLANLLPSTSLAKKETKIPKLPYLKTINKSASNVNIKNLDNF